MSQVTRLHDSTLALSDFVLIDERISWHPPGKHGIEPYNEYIIEGDGVVLLVDGGVRLHATSIIKTLREIVGSRKLYLYATRIELECIGNFGKLLAAFPSAELITANGVPLASLFHMPDFTSTNAPIYHMSIGDTLARFGLPYIKILQAPLRLLGTSWLWDKRSRVLFTSDSFNTDMLADLTEGVVRTTVATMPQPASIYASLIQKFDWLPDADTSSIRLEWDQLFANIDPLIIAPIHGRIQCGHDVIRRAIENHFIGTFERTHEGCRSENESHRATARA